MRKLLLLPFLFIFAIAGAQITILDSDLPQPGDTFLMAVDSFPQINLGTAGIQQAWDFSTLETDTLSFIGYGDATALPYAGDFPNSTMYQGVGELNALFLTNASGLYMNGIHGDFGFGMMSINYVDDEMLVGTPCTFGTNYTDNAEWGIAFADVPTDQDTFYVVTKVKTLDCDAWGSVVTPYGDYPDVVRIKSYAIEVSTIQIKIGGMTVYEQEVGRDTTVNYFFLTTGLQYIVASAELSADESTINYIEYMYTPVVQSGPIVSVANGNFTDPNTWDCMCMPLPGTHITVEHDVTLNTDFYFTNALIINASGSLTDDGNIRSVLFDTAAFANYGNFSAHYVSTNQGTFDNYNTITIHNAFWNEAEIYNDGLISGIDSLWNENTIININSITADKCTNNGFLDNGGILTFNLFTNSGSMNNNATLNVYDFYNPGTFYNFSSIQGSHDFTNAGYFQISTGGTFNLANDFLNSDGDNFDAQFVIDGSVSVDGNWMNVDFIEGSETGAFTIQNTTTNAGTMMGSFDLCDATPPASYPYVDFNSGSIDPNITFCGLTDVSELNYVGFRFYPNPVTDLSVFEFNCAEGSDYQLRITDITGREIFNDMGKTNGTIHFTNNGYASGLYLYELQLNNSERINGEISIK